MHQRQGDASQLAILEWVDFISAGETPTETAKETKPADKKEEKTAEAKA
jgi:hypothetical protein